MYFFSKNIFSNGEIINFKTLCSDFTAGSKLGEESRAGYTTNDALQSNAEDKRKIRT